MKVIGLTGSIGMGKSATAKMFEANGVPVFDADAAVHALQGIGGRALPLIEKEFPGSVADGVLDRPALGAMVFGDAAALKRLEAIMHPLVAEERQAFVHSAESAGKDIILFDEPILFEMGGDKACDYVVVVSAPASEQRTRVLARPNMTPEKFENILAKQMPDAEKRSKADFIVDTGKGFDHAEMQVKQIVEKIRED
ncbi:dephospho-CoA kinase [Kordiimonas sediminis]|uniref:Dephospho-CoA kinase n=1 Tax=Kordiimonas sediminis TaxID=1735581 RepID=A0A919ALJ5_9PROT|nr:dephospho-CoA kinase [Kordiimonas sediminis]GHF15475.1 dephospho-CoA kinase [Kordiimonas sediminis]